MAKLPDFDITRLAEKNSKYSADQKMEAAMHYVLTGSAEKTSRLTGISSSTIRKWKSEAVWWDMAINECRRQANRKLDGKLTHILHKTVEGLLERLVEGNEKLDVKTGNRGYEKVPAAQLSAILATIHDKRALLRGDPTARTETVSKQEILKTLAEDFKKMYQANLDANIGPESAQNTQGVAQSG